jgi:hypothetical protein
MSRRSALGKTSDFLYHLALQNMSGPSQDFALSILYSSNDTTALYLSFIASIPSELFFRLDIRQF